MSRRKGGRRGNRGRLPRRRNFEIWDPQKEGIMSIKGDVLEHLINHPNEVISLTALASGLDVTLDQVRSAISALRVGTRGGGKPADEKASMRDTLKIVSRGYAVKYMPNEPTPAPILVAPTPADVPKKHVVTTVVDSGSDSRPAHVEAVMTDEPTIPIGMDHPYSDDVDVVLAQLGPTAHKVFAYVASQNGQNVTTDDVAEATGLSRSAVVSACYNTLFNKRQLNRNARRLFVKVGKGVFRMSTPGDGVIIGPALKHSGLPAVVPTVPSTSDSVVSKITEKPDGDKVIKTEPPKSSDQKRLFEELRVLPDGAVLIEDEEGRVYKAREV
jgi:hypothetical protein